MKKAASIVIVIIVLCILLRVLAVFARIAIGLIGILLVLALVWLVISRMKGGAEKQKPFDPADNVVWVDTTYEEKP